MLKDQDLRGNNLGRHRGLSNIDEAVSTKLSDRSRHLLVHKLARLLACQTVFPPRTPISSFLERPHEPRMSDHVPVTSNDSSGVDLVLDKLVGSSKELSSEQNDRGGSVSDLLVLLLSKRDEDSGLRFQYK